MKKKITHSYKGLGTAYRKARKGSPGFASFMVAHAGLDANHTGPPYTIVELGVGSGQQTEFVEEELLSQGIAQYRILAYDKSYRQSDIEALGQLDILTERIQSGELSERVIPVQFNFDGTPLPLEMGSVDLVYMAHVIHHVVNKEKVLNEVARILRKNGTFFILGVTLEDMKNHPLDEFFPTKYGYEIGRYPPEPELKAMFESAGLSFEEPFKVGSHNIRPIDRDFLASVEDTTIDSVFMIMKEKDPQAFQDGVIRVTKEVEEAEKSGDFRTYYSLDRLRVFWGRKP